MAATKCSSVIVPAEFGQEEDGAKYAVEYGSLDVSPDGNSILFPFDQKVRLFDLTTKAATDLSFKKGAWAHKIRCSPPTASEHWS